MFVHFSSFMMSSKQKVQNDSSEHTIATPPKDQIWNKEILQQMLQIPKRVVKTTFRSDIKDEIRAICTQNKSLLEFLEENEYPKQELIILLLIRGLHASINIIPREYFKILPEEERLSNWIDCKDCLLQGFTMHVLEVYIQSGEYFLGCRTFEGIGSLNYNYCMYIGGTKDSLEALQVLAGTIEFDVYQEFQKDCLEFARHFATEFRSLEGEVDQDERKLLTSLTLTQHKLINQFERSSRENPRKGETGRASLGTEINVVTIALVLVLFAFLQKLAEKLMDRLF